MYVFYKRVDNDVNKQIYLLLCFLHVSRHDSLMNSAAIVLLSETLSVKVISVSDNIIWGDPITALNGLYM